MSEEEKKAIEKLDRLTVYENLKGNIGIPVMIKDLKTVLNLTTKLQKENEEKDKEIKKYKNMIIEHKKQLRQSGIYGYDYDLKID